MLRIHNSKKNKSNPKKIKNKSQISIPPKYFEKPEWNSDFTDLERYKISQTELFQKKISLMSKYKIEVKELWDAQQKNQTCISDKETKSAIDPCSKKLPKNNQKNLSTRKSLNDMEQEEDDDELEDTEDDDEALEINQETGKGQENDLRNNIEKNVYETEELIRQVDERNKKAKRKVINLDKRTKTLKCLNQKTTFKKKSTPSITTINSKIKIAVAIPNPVKKHYSQLKPLKKVPNNIKEFNLSSSNFNKICGPIGLQLGLGNDEDIIKIIDNQLIEHKPNSSISLFNVDLQTSKSKLADMNKSDFDNSVENPLEIDIINFYSQKDFLDKTEFLTSKSSFKGLTEIPVF